MRNYFGLVILAAASLSGCNESPGSYLAASVITRDGIARNGGLIRERHGREVRLWGYVDYSNLYGDSGAKAILAEFWSGDGPSATTWRFDLKAKETDAAGHSFAVHVPNEPGRQEVLRTFVANARAGRPTQVFLTGRVFAYDAPTNAVSLTGLYMVLRSSSDVRVGAPGEY